MADPAAPIDPRARIDHVVLRVEDVGRAVAFYAAVAGLEPDGESPDGAALRSPGGGPVLVRLERSAEPGPAPERAAGLFHTALRWPGRAGLGGALARVVQERWPLTGASDHGVSEALYLDDPDGNGVELYWDRPREAWPEPGPGERVGMYTLPLDLRDLLAGAALEDAGMDVGHVHLKVSDLDAAVGFWHGALGLNLQQRFGTQAAFLAAGDYHHHVGANTWLSRGAPLGAAARPGLERVGIAFPDEAAREVARARLEEAGVALDGDRFRDPDGIVGELAVG